MNVIFLDIDGVLNNRDTFIRRYKEYLKTKVLTLEIDEEKVELLKSIVEITVYNIVLSSSWRIFFEKKDNIIIANHSKGLKLNSLLKKYGMYIYDMTPYDTNRNRFLEIKQYLLSNNISNYIILDDELIEDSQIRIKNSLTKEDTIKILKSNGYIPNDSKIYKKA